MTFEEWKKSRNMNGICWGDLKAACDFATMEERESCAQLCDEIANNTEPDDFALDAVNAAAAKIRERSNV